jgi:DNA-binding transcriptional MerR regulator
LSSYQITDLERLTGVKAHTIRIWEKRYSLIEPHRTSTNIRFYDDDQARKLLKVSTLLSQGLKISKISLLSDKEINFKIQELEKNGPNDVKCFGYINELIVSMLSFDEAGFERAFSSAVVNFGMYHAMLKVFYPFLHKTGLMWALEEAMPVQEHFATSIIRRKLINAIDGLLPPTKKSKTFLLFLPQDEWHETALLFSDYIIRSKGYKTIYLGQNVPVDNLKHAISHTKPNHVLTLYIARRELTIIEKELTNLSKQNPELKFLVAGSLPLEKIAKKLKNLIILYSPEDLLKLL